MPKRETSKEFHELRLLEALEEKPEARQVDLAARVGIAVGTVNWHLKRLAAKGYVKVKRIGQWRWRYLLTPKGMAEKTKLTKAYIQYSMRLYLATRETTRRLLAEIKKAGYNRVRLKGDNNLVDVCRLTCLEQGVKVVGPDKMVGQENQLPVLRVAGQELSLQWPERGAKREDPNSGRIEVNRQRLDEVIRRIVEVAQPEQIILFGSTARGEMGPDSDLDLLVIKSGVHRRRLAQQIYMNLFGVGQAVDVIVVTPEDIDRYRDAAGLIIEPALREGKIVYERKTSASR